MTKKEERKYVDPSPSKNLQTYQAKCLELVIKHNNNVEKVIGETREKARNFKMSGEPVEVTRFVSFVVGDKVHIFVSFRRLATSESKTLTMRAGGMYSYFTLN